MAAYEKIAVVGMAHPSQFPSCLPNHPATQVCQADKLWLGNIKCLKKIAQVCAGLQICDSRVICTPLGRKLVVEGIKQIKVIYVEEHCAEKRSMCFQIPFVAFVLLRESVDKIIKVCALMEDISASQLNSRTIVVTTVIFVCPIFAPKLQEALECAYTCEGGTDSVEYREICYYEPMMVDRNFSGSHKPREREDCCFSGGKNYYYGR